MACVRGAPDLQLGRRFLYHSHVSQTLFRYDNALQRADIVRDGGNAERDDTLETAVTISLGTYASAQDGSTEEGGFWGEPYLDLDRDDVFGDRTWSIAKTLPLATKLRTAEQHTKDALRWMIKGGLAARVSVSASVTEPGRLDREITIERLDGSEYTTLWSATLAAF